MNSTDILNALPTNTIATWTFDGEDHAAKRAADGRWFLAYRCASGARCANGILTADRFAAFVANITDLNFVVGIDLGDRYPLA